MPHWGRGMTGFEIKEGTVGSEEFWGSLALRGDETSKGKAGISTYRSGTLDIPHGDSGLETSRFKDRKEMRSLSHTDFVGTSLAK